MDNSQNPTQVTSAGSKYQWEDVLVRSGAHHRLSKVLRVRNKTLGLAADVVERWGEHVKTTAKGAKKIRLGMRVDRINHAIQIIPNDVGGVQFSLTENGYATASSPAHFKQIHMPVGDYTMQEGDTSVFELAR